MNIYLREIKSYRRSTIIWAVSLSLIAITFLSLYPSFAKDVDQMKQTLASFPPALKNALNLSVATFFTIYGFFAYMLNFLLLAAAIQATNLGVGILAKEDFGKTSDFLLTKPISRASVVAQKSFAGLTVLVLTNIILGSVVFVTANFVSKESINNSIMLLLIVEIFIVQLVFYVLGLLLAVTIPKIKSVIAVALPTVFIFFIAGTLGEIFGRDEVRYISPFKFFDSQYVIKNTAYEPQYLIIGIVFILIAMSLTYLIYIKKDIRSAV